MNGEKERLTGTCLVYFGKMMAAISHEIKNSLAIINENAGLMEDLSLMAKGGNLLDPERIGAISGRVIKQIERADTIVKKMNKLAHSVDDPLKELNIFEILEFTIELGKKSISSLGVDIKVVPPASPAIINASQFMVMNLFWEVIGYVGTRLNGATTMTINIVKKTGFVELVFTSVSDSGDGAIDLDKVSFGGLAATLHASLNLADNNALVLRVPDSVEII